jgi:hypothetical protein
VRPPLRALLVAALTALLALAGSGVALAHASLVSSAPADGETLATPPAQLVLVFDADVVDLGAEAVVTGPSGTPVAVTGVVVDGPTVTWSLDPAAAAGAHTASWRVTSADGHPVEGSFGYTVAAPSPAPEAAPEPTGDPTAAPSAEPSAAADAPAVGAGGPGAPADPQGAGSAVGWLVTALAAAGAAAAVVARRRRFPSGRS